MRDPGMGRWFGLARPHSLNRRSLRPEAVKDSFPLSHWPAPAKSAVTAWLRLQWVFLLPFAVDLGERDWSLLLLPLFLRKGNLSFLVR